MIFLPALPEGAKDGLSSRGGGLSRWLRAAFVGASKGADHHRRAQL